MTSTHRPLVYMAQPMASTTWALILDAQREMLASLSAHGLDGLSPVSGLDLSTIAPHGGPATVADRRQIFTQPRAFVARDLAMIRRADALLVDLRRHHFHTPSVGVSFELGFAAALAKPVVFLLPERARGLPFPPFWQHATPAIIQVFDLADACLALASVLLPGVNVSGLSSPPWATYDAEAAVFYADRASREAPSRSRSSGRLSVQADEQGTRGAVDVENPTPGAPTP